MFLIWMQLAVAAAWANPKIPLNTSCEQIETTLNLEGFLTSHAINIISDCIDLPNITENYTDSELTGDFRINANTTNEAVTTPILPAWYPLFLKVQFVARGIFMPIVAVFGIIGNSLTLCVLRKGVLPPTSAIYLLGMTVAGLLYTINLFPAVFQAYDTLRFSNIMKSINAIRYSYFVPLTFILHTAAVYITTCFTIERLIAVRWPLKAKELSTKRRAWIAVIGAYVFGFALNCVRFFYIYRARTVDPVTQEVHLTFKYTVLGRSKTASVVTFWSYFILVDTIPFVLLVCLNSYIILCVWLAHRRRVMMTDKDPKDNMRNSREKQITRLLISIVIAYLVCNTCSGLFGAWLAMYGNVASRMNPYVYYISSFGTVLLVANPLANFILYVVCSSAFREGLKSQFCPKRMMRETSNQTKSSVVHETKSSEISGK